jgi:uncharacterized protein
LVRRGRRDAGRGGRGVGVTSETASAEVPDELPDGLAPVGLADIPDDEVLAEPFRRCFATGTVRPKAELLRFVVGPDGTIVPDVAARLPGRGLWLTARRDIIELAVAKRLFGRAARASVTVPGDLAERVERLLRERCCDLIGFARRSGLAVAGFEKVRKALREGEAGVLLAASDGGEDGREKIRACAPTLPLIDLLTAGELAAAFGREHVVHAVIGRGRICRALLGEAARLSGFREPTEIETGRGPRERRRRNADDGTGSR